jgi:hypothetical protein
MTKIFGIAALVALSLAATALAAPAPDAAREPGTDPRRALDSDLPTDRPIVATVLEVDEESGTVTLSTPHGNVALTVSAEVAERLHVGDVVVVRFVDSEEDDFPAASPREVAPPAVPQKI